MITIELTEDEAVIACSHGCRREIRSAGKRSKDNAGFDNSEGAGLAIHSIGAMGEMAFAKAFGLWFGYGLELYHCPDIGNVHIRTRTKTWQELYIRPDDANGVYVLVSVDWPGPTKFWVRGWIDAAEAKRHPEWLKTHGGRPPAYFVPHSALRHPSELQVVM